MQPEREVGMPYQEVSQFQGENIGGEERMVQGSKNIRLTLWCIHWPDTLYWQLNINREKSYNI